MGRASRLGSLAHSRAHSLVKLKARSMMESATKTLDPLVVARTIQERAATSTEACTDANLCEKPYTSGNLAVILGVIIGVLFAFVLCVLLYLHNRKKKQTMLEDEHHRSLDFGVGGAKQKSMHGFDKETMRHKGQLSMDMNLESPYLLPPDLHGSRESLARTLNSNEDPYRHIAKYTGSEVGSIRSMSRGPGDGQSVRTVSRGPGGRRLSNAKSVTGSVLPRRNSGPKSPLSPVSPSAVHLRGERPFDDEKIAAPPRRASPVTAVKPIIAEAITPTIEFVHEQEGPDRDSQITAVPSITSKEKGWSKNELDFPSFASGGSSPADSAVDVATPRWDQGSGKDELSFGFMPEPAGVGLGLLDQPKAARKPSITVDTAVGVAVSPPIIEEPEEHNFMVGEQVRKPESEKEGGEKQQANGQEHGSQARDMHQASGLGIPQKDSHRLSVGFRPLPPGEILESEDPEYRANRIRSFYKEYFDENAGRADPNAPPMPLMPSNKNFPLPRGQQAAAPPQGNGGQYYGEMDPAAFPEHGAYFDPASNAFVMPYAQPVTRRAMTPPPSSQRRPFPGGPGMAGGRPMGPGGPPRDRRPSLVSTGSGMGMGPRGPAPRGGPLSASSRPGSGASSNYGPRPGSSVSAQAYGRARAASAMAGPRKPMPPPAALSTLPTPSQLKDDNFAIFNAADFAPPESFGSRARGRSQSPMGERKPYKLNVPAASPLVTAFEELAVLPSPHLLRQSSTFTGLDFAPPRKFGETSDARSETGSIRSNHTGISQAQQIAIRNGAGRVSRLPGDQVFTAAAMSETLKPKWGMRQ